MQSMTKSTEFRPHRVSNLVLCFTSCMSALLAPHLDAHRHSIASRSSRVPFNVASRSGCVLSTRLARTSNLLKSHARHGLRSSKASSMIRANFMTEEKEEKLSTLAGLCPRVSGHVKSQGSRSQPSFDKQVRHPGVRCSRYPYIEDAW